VKTIAKGGRGKNIEKENKNKGDKEAPCRDLHHLF